MYAIVDIETTGGHASANGITEIAICIHDGREVVKRYQTLVNPGKHIPVYIQALTGISEDMVQDAPTFKEVAYDIFNLLQGHIFVAHNVNFDHSFVKYHLAAAGYDLQCNKLCTVRLSRKIIPGMTSYSLGKLCHQLGIGNDARHRAAGDANATAELFTLLLNSDTHGHIPDALKQRSKEQTLPPNLHRKFIEKLPATPGVYYFHDSKGKVVYVGKAINIKKRVNSHFAGNNSGQQRQDFMRHIHQVSYQECGTELMALLTEAVEIKRLWPKFNRSQKNLDFNFGIYTYEDQRGYLRMAVDKRRKYSTPSHTCSSLLEGRNLLTRLIEQYELCPKLCFIQNNNDTCVSTAGERCACTGHESVEVYNEKVERAISGLEQTLPTFALRDEGRKDDEHSCILIEKGRLYGMGYISHYFEANTLSQLKNYLTPYAGNDYMHNMIISHAERYPWKRLSFDAVMAEQ
ncbi:GIY-YIG nuclease family protein [Mucilaginibacter daejeonensis]|uniref:exonuclease domain-containing protein n=1 Tax=Mucilaginibacter daejeonensis TaxID=398049 RepID=UPI001D178AC2|nr:exonuclease domain-containing protein [Mucilaginibacter daejeonensis]UEG51618.1 GIY-YIG nuclease family protein [Mucilaginibacter daejeonensis]